MKNTIKYIVVMILLCVTFPLYAQEGAGQNSAIAEIAQYVFIAVIAFWILKKIFKK